MTVEAVVYLSIAPDGLHHVRAETEGSTVEEALSCAHEIAETFAKGKRTMFRAWPEAGTEKNFDTKIERHLGYVRFSYLNEPGEWTGPSNENEPIGFGFVKGVTT